MFKGFIILNLIPENISNFINWATIHSLSIVRTWPGAAEVPVWLSGVWKLWGGGQIATILLNTFQNKLLIMAMHVFWLKLHFSQGSISHALSSILAWTKTDDKLFSKPMMTCFIDTYMRSLASISHDICFHHCGRECRYVFIRFYGLQYSSWAYYNMISGFFKVQINPRLSHQHHTECDWLRLG